MSTDEPDADDLPPAVRETLDSLGGALGDIAELDKEQLNETIGLLETLGHDQAAGILRSRREVLKGAGAATGLGIAGLAGASATGGARAQSDTQTGTIGNGNQDADLQDVSAESVKTGETRSNINSGQYQSAIDGLVVPVADGLGVADAIDPQATSNPLQDAIDKIDSVGEGGLVHLPAGVIEFGSELDFKGNQIVFDGLGNTPQTEANGITTIEFTGSGSTTTHALTVGGDDDGSGFRNLTFKGPGSGATVGNAIRFPGNPEGFKLDNVTFSAWGSEPVIESVDKPFDMNWGKVEYHDIGGGFMLLNDLGPNNHIDMLRTRGGEFILDQRSGSIQIDTINSGGDPGAGGPSDEMIRTHGGLEFDYWNFEPSGTFDGTTLLYHKFNNIPTRLGRVINRGTTDYILEVNTVGNATYGPFYNSGTVNTSIASANGDVVSPVGYDGPTSDWDSSGFGARIHCLDGDIT